MVRIFHPPQRDLTTTVREQSVPPIRPEVSPLLRQELHPFRIIRVRLRLLHAWSVRDGIGRPDDRHPFRTVTCGQRSSAVLMQHVDARVKVRDESVVVGVTELVRVFPGACWSAVLAPAEEMQ